MMLNKKDKLIEKLLDTNARKRKYLLIEPLKPGEQPNYISANDLEEYNMLYIKEEKIIKELVALMSKD